jgi:hypothetical protein
MESGQPAPPTATVEDIVFTDRDEDFVRFVIDDVATRRAGVWI